MEGHRGGESKKAPFLPEDWFPSAQCKKPEAKEGRKRPVTFRPRREDLGKEKGKKSRKIVSYDLFFGLIGGEPLPILFLTRTLTREESGMFDLF